VEQHVAQVWPGEGNEPSLLSGYLPALASRRLAGRDEPLREPEGEQLTAAVLFADISGFTALTERLAGTGPSGVEELTELLNGCFGDLVQLVADHGGDVVKYAGDALLALWPLVEATQLALARGIDRFARWRLQEGRSALPTTHQHVFDTQLSMLA
jgi:class 3 adenylate cyclase